MAHEGPICGRDFGPAVSVPTPRIELGTYRLGGGRSIQLSYEGGAGTKGGRETPLRLLFRLTRLMLGGGAGIASGGRGPEDRM